MSELSDFVEMHRDEIDRIIASVMHEKSNPIPNDKERIEWCKWHPRLKEYMRKEGYRG